LKGEADRKTYDRVVNRGVYQLHFLGKRSHEGGLTDGG